MKNVILESHAAESRKIKNSNEQLIEEI
jgi:hypothetical protein